MEKKLLSAVLAVSMVLCLCGCSASGDGSNILANENSRLLSVHAEDAGQSGGVSGVVVETGSGSLLYNSIGSILSSRGEETEAAEEESSEGTAVCDGTHFGTMLIGQIMQDRLDEDASEAEEDKPISGFDAFTVTVSRSLPGLGAPADGDEIADDDTDPDSTNVDTNLIPIEDVVFLNLYQKGITDHSVAYIQQRLMDLGFMDSAEPTDYYGSATTEAVKRFQRENDLEQNGVLDLSGLALLIGDEAKSYTMRKGMSGSDVSEIQRRLYELGYLYSTSLITGTFADKTESAVRDFQTANGLVPDGRVSMETRELLYSEKVTANILSFGEKSDVVKACQERLKALGYLKTEPDGYYGNDTLAAVKNFQSKNNLVVDGYLGPSTREVLDSSRAVANGIGLGDEGETVRSIQKLLIKYGYMNEGSSTGYYGQITTKAVKEFQKNNGLSATGDVNDATMNKLKSDNVVAAVKQTEKKDEKKDTEVKETKKENTDDDTGSTVSGSVEALLKVAKSKVGCKYVYGAKGPNQFDCSGFVYWCLNQIGIKQSYITSYGWRTVGKYQKITKYSSLKAGDIIVVTGHVGIVAENGTVVDASSTNGKIMHRELNSWWSNRFICGWRIFD